MSATWAITMTTNASILPAMIVQRGMGAVISLRKVPSWRSLSRSDAIAPTMKKANMTVKLGTTMAKMLSGTTTRSLPVDVTACTFTQGSDSSFCT